MKFLKDSDKQDYIYSFLENLCFVDIDKHRNLIVKFFYQTYHISIIELQAKLIFKLLKKDLEKSKNLDSLYKK